MMKKAGIKYGLSTGGKVKQIKGGDFDMTMYPDMTYEDYNEMTKYRPNSSCCVVS